MQPWGAVTTNAGLGIAAADAGTRTKTHEYAAEQDFTARNTLAMNFHPPSSPARLRATWQLLVLLGVILLSGCANELNLGKGAKTISESRTELAAPLNAEYRIRAGDKLDIKFFYARELNEALVVRTDGRISLQLVGDLQAAGITPNQLAENISKAYANELRAPDATVVVRESAARIFVGGEITRPTFVKLDMRLTALQAIFAAGGFTPFAQPASVILLRKVEGEDRIAVRVDLSDTEMEGKQDLVLAADDVIFVPKSAIAKWDKVVEQYVQQAIPIQLAYRRDPFTTTIGSFR